MVNYEGPALLKLLSGRPEDTTCWRSPESKIDPHPPGSLSISMAASNPGSRRPDPPTYLLTVSAATQHSKLLSLRKLRRPIFMICLVLRCAWLKLHFPRCSTRNQKFIDDFLSTAHTACGFRCLWFSLTLTTYPRQWTARKT